MGRSRTPLALAAVLLFIAGCSDSTKPTDEGSANTTKPLALVGLLLQHPPREIPTEDLYLVELGQPVDEGILVDDDSGYRPILLGSVDAEPWTDATPEAEGFVRLPDGRVLVGIARPSDADDENTDQVGAMVVDPETGSVDEVFRDVGEFSWDAAGTIWDADASMLRSYSDRCFTWTAETAGSGFSELPCPDVPSPEEAAGELERWDFTCCDPFQITDRETGDVVYELTGIPAPAGGNSEDLPRFIDQEGETLLFSVPFDLDQHDIPPRRLLVLTPDGSVSEIAAPTWESGLDRVDIAAKIVGDAVIYSETVTENPDIEDRLLRYDTATGTSEELATGGRIDWTVVPADEPWLMAWQAPIEASEPMVTTLWTGSATAGDLTQVAEWDDTSVDDYRLSVHEESQAVLFTTSDSEHPGEEQGRATRLWQIARTGAPDKLAEAGSIELLGMTTEGPLVKTVPDGCDRYSADEACDESLEVVVDGQRTSLGFPAAPFIWPPRLLSDQMTIVVGARVDLGGAPYEDAIWSATVDDPGTYDEIYGPGDDLPAGAKLAEIDGASFEDTLIPLTTCWTGCDDPDLPQPNDAAVCTFEPTAPGC